MVSNVEIYFIAHFYTFNIIWIKVASNHRHINMDFVSFTFYPGITISKCGIGVFVFSQLEYLSSVFGNNISRNSGSVMWFANGWEIQLTFDFIAANVI